MSDPAEFETLMRNYQNMVFTTAYRLTANHAEAQDISQAVFLKAWERFDSLKDNPAVGGWLKTVATNLSLNHLSRYKKRWRMFSDMQREDAEGETQDFVSNQPAPETRESHESAQHETREILEEALAKLPPAQRAAIVLFHFEEMPYQEIADKLKVSLAKVKIDIMRGRQALKQKLAGQLSELEFES
jgi:RNA polymerase sigma-70 factor (ECF subfamily)